MKRLILFLFLLDSLFSFAGGTVRVKGQRFSIVPVISGLWQPTFRGEFELCHVFDIHYVNRHYGRTILASIKLGTEFNLVLPKGIPSNKQELWAPKFSSEVDLGYVCLRVNIEDYMVRTRNIFYATPEAGLTLSGFLTVAVGYNKPLEKNRLDGIKPLRITVNWMLPIILSGRVKQR